MITLFRWVLLKQKEIKFKLAFYQLIDRYVTTMIKNPEELEQKILPYLAEIIHKTNDNTK